MKWFAPSQRADGFKPGAGFTVIDPARTGPLTCNVLSTPVPLCRWLGSGAAPPDEQQDKGYRVAASEDRPEGMHKSIRKAEGGIMGDFFPVSFTGTDILLL